MIDLKKAAERVRIVLEKKKLPKVRAQVVSALDVSGSAQSLYHSGTMQNAFEVILPLALEFDDNGEVDVFTFSDGPRNVKHIETNATKENYSNYVKKNILDDYRVPKWGATDYAPVMEKILEDFGFYKSGFFGGKSLQKNSKSGDPVIVFFKTDGQNSDQAATRRLFEAMEKAGTQLYTLFIGIGNPNLFKNIVDLGEERGNVGFLSVKDLNQMVGKDDIYDLLLPDELINWLR